MEPQVRRRVLNNCLRGEQRVNDLDRPLSGQKGLFRAPWLKVGRAGELVEEFERRYNTWRCSAPYVIELTLEAERAEKVAKIRRTIPFPNELSCVIADCFHNLRSALDQLAYILATEIVGFTDEKQLVRCGFPVTKDFTEFESRLKADFFANQQVVEFLQECEPYPGGVGASLYAINELDNSDKHRSIVELYAADRIRVDIGGGRLWISLLPGGPDEVEFHRFPADQPEPNYSPQSIARVERAGITRVAAQSLNTLGGYGRSVGDVLNRAQRIFDP
jgi:hypothetical protein